MAVVRYCVVTCSNGLNIRSEPDTGGTVVWTAVRGTVLDYQNIVNGEIIDGNPYWGHSLEGHYYWMGGTDHPQG